MEANTNDEEAPKDPGASKALTSLQDNDIFGKLNRFTKQKKSWWKRDDLFWTWLYELNYVTQTIPCTPELKTGNIKGQKQALTPKIACTHLVSSCTMIYYDIFLLNVKMAFAFFI